MPEGASASYASYASVVKSVYEQALRPNLPDQVASNNENTKVSITVASDGTVISSRIISSSGDPTWDAAVQRTLDQVTTIAPFPEGATEKERHYTLSFNPEVEKSFE
jgi:TonB family protein